VRHRAEIFANDDAMVATTLLADDARELRQRKLHIAAAVTTARNHEQPREAERMVEPDRAGMPHDGMHQYAHRGTAVRRQRLRIERRQAPVLPRRIELVGWRANRNIG